MPRTRYAACFVRTHSMPSASTWVPSNSSLGSGLCCTAQWLWRGKAWNVATASLLTLSGQPGQGWERAVVAHVRSWHAYIWISFGAHEAGLITPCAYLAKYRDHLLTHHLTYWYVHRCTMTESAVQKLSVLYIAYVSMLYACLSPPSPTLYPVSLHLKIYWSTRTCTRRLNSGLNFILLATTYLISTRCCTARQPLCFSTASVNKHL